MWLAELNDYFLGQSTVCNQTEAMWLAESRNQAGNSLRNLSVSLSLNDFIINYLVIFNCEIMACSLQMRHLHKESRAQSFSDV